MCENIRSLHNVGSVFRCADAAGFDGVCLAGYTGAPPDRRIEKVSLGAEESVTWWHELYPLKALKQLKMEGFQLVALEQTADSTDVFSCQFEGEKIALIIGNEVEGVTLEALALCDKCVEIPMRGAKKSLNVSVACGIALYALAG